MHRPMDKRSMNRDTLIHEQIHWLAHRAAFEMMSDAGLILDAEDQVRGLNASARLLFSDEQAEMVGRPLDEALAGWPELVAELQGKSRPDETTTMVHTGAGRTYSLSVRTLQDPGSGESVRLVTLRESDSLRAVERALTRSAEKFRTIFEESLDVIMVLDGETGEILQINPATTLVMGYRKEDLVGKHFKTLFPPDSNLSRDDLVEKLEVNGSAFESQSFYRADGSICMMDLTATLIPWEEDRAILATFRDVTERNQTADALRESRERLRTVVTGAPILLFAMDEKGVITLSEGRALEALGLRPREVVGRSVVELFEEVPEIVQDVNHALSGDEFTTVIQLHGLTLEVRYSPILSENGDHAGAIGVALDITDRVRTEEALRESETLFENAFSNAAIGMALVAPDGRYLRVNRAMSEMLGYSEREFLGRDFMSITHPGDLEISLHHSERLLSRETEAYHLEKRYLHKDGDPVWAQISVSLVRDQQGQPLYFFIQVVDITERKRSEQLHAVSYEIADAAVNAQSLESLCATIQTELGNIIDTKNFYIALYDRETHQLRFPYYVDENSPDLSPYDSVRGRPVGKGMSEYLMKVGHGVLATRASIQELADRGAIEIVGKLPLSWLGAPLMSEGTTIGVIAVQSYTDKTIYTEEDLQLLQFASSQIAVSIERKQAEHALRKSEEKYRLVVENANEAIVVAQDGVLKFVNPKAVELTGYTRAELATVDFVEIVHPEDRETVLDQQERRLRGEDLPNIYAFRIIDKMGEVRWLEINAVFITWEDRPATLNFLTDITQRKRTDEALQQYAKQLEALQQVSLEVIAELDVDSLLHSIVARAVELLKGAGGGLSLYRAERDALEWTILIGSDLNPAEAQIRRGEGLSGKVWETGEPTILDDDWVENGRRETEHDSARRGGVGVPIRWRGEFLGVLIVFSERPAAFSKAHAGLLALFANQAAIALVNARLFTAERRRRDEAETLRTVSNALASTLEQDQVLELILIQLADVIEYDSASVMLREDESLRVMAARGFEDDDAVLNTTFPASNPLSEEIRRSGRAIWLSDPASDPRFQGWSGTQGIKSWMGLPLLVRGKLIGYMTLDSYQEEAYGEKQVALVQPFANQAAQAIENARLFDWVQRQAITDALTGLYNRRGLFELGKREFDRAYRFDRTLSAIMLDIDHFKRVNDQYGHFVGDQVLCEIAERCAQVIRKVDFLGRYGGEEFAILLPETDFETACRVAERIRAAIADAPVIVDRCTLSITISLGVSMMSRRTPDLDSLLESADAAMYAAKQAGRNCVRAVRDEAE